MPITITAAEAPADRLLFDYVITYLNKTDHASKIVALRALKLLVGTPFEADVRNRTKSFVVCMSVDRIVASELWAYARLPAGSEIEDPAELGFLFRAVRARRSRVVIWNLS